MRVLGIETSCDETAAAVYDSERGLLAHRLFSQVSLHVRYGGVVPELASRDHAQQIVPLIQNVLAEARITVSELSGIAYTAGPGLHGALLVGAMLGRTLGFALNIPTVAIHHMEGHLLAPMLEADPPAFPFVALLVSGGHTLLVRVDGIGQYQLLGESVDDAAGEAFDKVARLLGLPYPGGPSVARCAMKGDPTRFQFPKPMTERPGCDFSFSGLKTAVKQAWEQSTQDEQTKADIASAFEQAVVSTLMLKCRRALQQTGLSTLVLAGGVSANQQLRKQMQVFGESNHVRIVVARPEFCTDNAAMIAYAGWCRLREGQHDPLEVFVYPRWSLESVQRSQI